VLQSDFVVLSEREAAVGLECACGQSADIKSTLRSDNISHTLFLAISINTPIARVLSNTEMTTMKMLINYTIIQHIL
jgi:hypothetical protein